MRIKANDQTRSCFHSEMLIIVAVIVSLLHPSKYDATFTMYFDGIIHTFNVKYVTVKYNYN